MRNNPASSPHDPADNGGGPPSGVALLAAAVSHVTQGFEELLAAYRSTLRDEVAGETGLSVDEWMTLSAGLPPWLVTQVESVAGRMDVLPELTVLFYNRVLSFTQLALVVRETSQFNGKVLHDLDIELASLAIVHAEQGLLHQWEWEVVSRTDAMRAPGWANRQERRAEKGQSVSFQHGFDGGGLAFASLDAVGMAMFETMVDAATPDGPEPLSWRRAHGLVTAASEWLDGSGSGRKAKVAMNIVIDLATATPDRFGQLMRVAGGGHVPTLSAQMIETLSKNSKVIATICDGARPLAQLKVKTPKKIAAKIRRAVLDRDKGCRFPGCRAPLRRINVHHIIHREDGGTDDPDNLIALCSYHHLQYVHKRHWKPKLDPVTAHVTWRRGKAPPISSTPHGSRPPPRYERWNGDLPDWLAPPIPPPPAEAPPQWNGIDTSQYD